MTGQVSVVDSDLVSSEVKELVMERVMGWVKELVMERVSSEVMEQVMGWVKELVLGWVTGQVKALVSFGEVVLTAQEIDFSGFFAPPDRVADELPGSRFPSLAH